MKMVGGVRQKEWFSSGCNCCKAEGPRRRGIFRDDRKLPRLVGE